MWRSLFRRDTPDGDGDGDGDGVLPPDGTPSPESFSDRMLQAMKEVGWTARGGGGRLPVAALPQLGLIEDLIYPLLHHLRDQPPNVDEEIAVQGIVGDYLPTTVNTYLGLHPQVAGQPRADGRTPGDDLLEQLEILEGAVRDLAQAIYAQDAQQLAVQGRFLNAKFSRSDLEL